MKMRSGVLYIKLGNVMSLLRLTDTNRKDSDTYTEDFRDDYDNVDRFTDDNAYRENFRLIGWYTIILW